MKIRINTLEEAIVLEGPAGHSAEDTAREIHRQLEGIDNRARFATISVPGESVVVSTTRLLSVHVEG